MTRTSGEDALVRALGVWGLAANIVNITVGGGIFRLPAAAAAALGPAAPAAYVVCAVVMGLIVVCFAEAGSRVSLTGGLYAYTETAFGPFVGFMSGALLWVGITAATAAVASFFADALVALLPSLASPVARGGVLTVVLVLLALLNIAGVSGASRFNTVMTVAKLLPLALLIVVGIGAVRASNLAWPHAPAPGNVARASAVLIFAFLGVESALVPSGEVRDPARTVPRAIFVAMAGIAVLYLVVQIVAQGVLGASLATEKTPLAAAASAVLGPAGGRIILIGSIVSMFGYVSGMTLAVPRMLFAFARDGFLPRAVGAVHQRARTPHVAIAVQTVIVIALALSGSFEWLAILANGSILLVYLGCCAAVLVLRRRDVRTGETAFAPPAGGVVPLVAMLAIVWLLSGLSLAEWKAIGLAAIAAVAVYVATLPRRRAAVIS